MGLMQIKERRPFHEVVVEVIAVASNVSLNAWPELLKQRKFPRAMTI